MQDQIKLGKRLLQLWPNGHKEIIFNKDRIILSINYNGKTFEREFSKTEFQLFRLKKLTKKLKRLLNERRMETK